MHGDGMVYKGGRIYWLQYFRDGKRIQISAKTESRAIALAKLPKLNRTADDDFLGLHERSVMIGGLVANLLQHYGTNGKTQYRKDAASRWEHHLRRHFGNVRASRFGSAQQHAYRAARLAEGASNTTVNREFAVLIAAFKLGTEQEPPLVRRMPRFHRTTENNARRGYATYEQIEVLRQATSGHSLWLRVMFELAVILGWRKGELQSLTCRSINLIDSIVRIEASKNGDAREAP